MKHKFKLYDKVQLLPAGLKEPAFHNDDHAAEAIWEIINTAYRSTSRSTVFVRIKRLTFPDDAPNFKIFMAEMVVNTKHITPYLNGFRSLSQRLLADEKASKS